MTKKKTILPTTIATVYEGQDTSHIPEGVHIEVIKAPKEEAPKKESPKEEAPKEETPKALKKKVTKPVK